MDIVRVHGIRLYLLMGPSNLKQGRAAYSSSDLHVGSGLGRRGSCVDMCESSSISVAAVCSQDETKGSA